MVSEIYTTYDYSFHCNSPYKPTRPPQTYNDILYHRIEERPNININMANINRNNKGETYYEFAYTPMLHKTLPNTDNKEINENSVISYLKKWFCCG